MNLPTIPTDNYYKFSAISGVVIVLTTTLFFTNKITEIFDDKDKIEADLAFLELQAEFLQ